MSVFAQAIDHDQDATLAMRRRKTFNEVEADRFPDTSRYGERLEKARFSRQIILVLLTGGAVTYVSLNLQVHLWPVKQRFNAMQGRISARVSSYS